MNLIMIGLLLREALDRIRVRLNGYLLVYMYIHRVRVKYTIVPHGYGEDKVR